MPGIPGKPDSPIKWKKIIYSDSYISLEKHKPFAPGIPLRPGGPGGPPRPTGPGKPIENKTYRIYINISFQEKMIYLVHLQHL